MSKHILLIEDEPNIIEAIRYILSRAGYKVDAHSDGATALTAILDRCPDIVILDVNLPNKSGFDVLRDMRELPATIHLPVLMLTARGQKKDREMAESFGASKFMTKPFSNAELLDVILGLTKA